MKPFAAIILAGDRQKEDPLRQAAGVPHKALVPIAGQPMLWRVLNVLYQSDLVNELKVVGSPDLQATLGTEALAAKNIQWLVNQSGPSQSAGAGLATCADDQPVLVTTADHALLSEDMVDYFCQQAHALKADVVVGVVRFSVVRQAYPEAKRTVIKLSDDGYCGCNLFAFMTPQGRRVTEYWQRIEHHRKKPWRIMQLLGWTTMLRFALGRLSLHGALNSLSKRWQLNIKAVALPFAQAAVDVDKVEDWHLVQAILADAEKGSALP